MYFGILALFYRLILSQLKSASITGNMDAAENQLTDKTGLIAVDKQRVSCQINTTFIAPVT